jgi:hypothetical protein
MCQKELNPLPATRASGPVARLRLSNWSAMASTPDPLAWNAVTSRRRHGTFSGSVPLAVKDRRDDRSSRGAAGADEIVMVIDGEVSLTANSKVSSDDRAHQVA